MNYKELKISQVVESEYLVRIYNRLKFGHQNPNFTLIEQIIVKLIIKINK